jgi:DNA replication and repair protein RecF
MTIRELHLEGFRNYSDATARFSDGVNVVVGRNAQGKTNLIEAVHYLSSGRSFRFAGDKELISHDCDGAYIKADVESGGREQALEARLSHSRRRELRCNGVKLKKASELSGRLAVVMFGPDDLDLIKDGAAVRRRLLDQCISQLRPAYHAALSEFDRLYKSKTRILKDHREKPSLLELLDDFDLRLAQQSARLIYYRSAFTGFLARKATGIHSEFSGGAETLGIRYKTVGGMDAAGKKPEELLPDLLAHQRVHRAAELASGTCLSGAHKDDLEIDLGGKPARKYASQGQMRTASVSIKIAERELHFDDRGEYPVLLLDDVLSELDERRRGYILGRIKSGQVIITCCAPEQVSLPEGGTVLRVEGGEIERK